ncbi:MAG: dCMP deaminase family protein [Sedimenticola sp.]
MANVLSVWIVVAVDEFGKDRLYHAVNLLADGIDAMSAKWDTRFLGLAAHISAWSKDPSSQVGAVITDGNRIVSLGYNGFAAGVVDAPDRLEDRNTKLNLTIHAEENAMIFAKRDLTDCTVYVTHPPCPRCASKLIQEEVARIVSIAPSDDFLSRWADDLELSMQMYREAGVEFTTYELDEINTENAQVTVSPGGFFKKVMSRCLNTMD